MYLIVSDDFSSRMVAVSEALIAGGCIGVNGLVFSISSLTNYSW